MRTHLQKKKKISVLGINFGSAVYAILLRRVDYPSHFYALCKTKAT